MIDFYTILVALSISTVVIFIIAIKAVQIRLKNLPYLKIIAIFMTASAISFGYGTILRAQHHLWGPAVIMMMHLLILLMFLSGYLYFEALHNIRPPILRFLLFWSLFLIPFIFISVEIEPSFENDLLIYFGFIYSFGYGVLVLGFGIRTLRITRKHYEHDGLKMDTLAFGFTLIGNVVFSTMGILVWYQIIDIYSLERDILMVIGTLFYIIGIVLLMSNSFKNRDYIYFIPIPIHWIMMYNRGGVCVYNRAAVLQETNIEIKSNPVLMSGALQAFSLFFKELLGSNANIRHIDATSSEFIFIQLPKEKGTFIMITSGVNYFLKKSMEDLCASFSDEILDLVENGNNLTEIESRIDVFVKEKFPYLTFQEITDEDRKALLECQ